MAGSVWDPKSLRFLKKNEKNQHHLSKGELNRDAWRFVEDYMFVIFLCGGTRDGVRRVFFFW